MFNKNVYILGAGFSRYAGAPLIADYIDKIRQYWEDPKSTLDRDERERFKHFLDYQSNLMSVRNKININLGNIEELLGLAEMEVEWGGSDPSLKDDYIYALLRTLELTTHCYDLGIFNDLSGLRWDSDSRLSKLACYYYSNGHKNSSLVKSIYQIFAHLFMLSPTDKENCPIDTIISFNYDLLLDSALLEVGLGIDYSIIKHSSDSKVDEYDNCIELPPDKPRVRYLKLHGSSNWALCRKCNNVFIFPPHIDELIDVEWIRKLQVSDNINRESYIRNLIKYPCPKCKNKSTIHPLIAPPTWNKFQYQKSFGEVWKKALIELREAHRLIIIGYSLPQTDTFFRYLLCLGCHTPSEQEIIIINPDEEGTKGKFQNFVDLHYQSTKFKFYKFKFEPIIFDNFAMRGLGYDGSFDRLVSRRL